MEKELGMLEQTDWVGKQLGHYRLLRLIGKGGFANVYLGEHVHLTTRAAVKLLHTRLSTEDIENFRREAQMIARLVHPNIVRVFDFGVENNIPYLVMDYAPDGTLRQRHAKEVQLSPSTVIPYVLQIAEALQYAHDQRLIHRDVKPENMLIGNRQEVLLSDFGIALLSQTSNFQHTRNIAGTVAYMAPEQIQAHPRPASDQYSLAVVVYEWLCGQRPFQGSFSELAVKHVLTPPPLMRSYTPNLSPAIEEVVMTALQKDPQQRFPNVRAFAQALQQASQRGSSSQLTPSTHVLPSSPPLALPVHHSSPFIGQQIYRPANNTFSAVPMPAVASHAPLSTPSPSTLLSPHASFVQTPAYPNGQSFPPHMIPGGPAQSSHRIHRRALFASAIGLVALSSGATWYVANQLSRMSSVLPANIGTNNPLSKLADSASSGSPVLTYSAQQDYVWAVDWSPDGKYIVSGSHDGTTHVWNAATAQRLLSYRSATKPAVSDNWAMGVSWSPDSKKIGIGFLDGTVQVVDIASGELVYTYGQHPAPPVCAVTWSSKGDYIAMSGGGGVKVYEVASQKLVMTFDKHTDTVITAVWSPDGKWLASGSTDGKVKVWKPFTGEEQLNYTGHSGELRTVAWSHDSTRLVSSSWDHTVKVWEATTGHTLYSYSEQPVPQLMDSAAWSHNDKYIALGSHSLYLRICDASTGKVLQSFNAYPVYSLAWSPDDKRIVTGGISNKRAQVWKVQ
jgi:serine/threonine protein kinase